MNKSLIKIYKYVLKYKFKIDTVKQVDDHYVVSLCKWLPPIYEPNRLVDIDVVLRAENEYNA